MKNAYVRNGLAMFILAVFCLTAVGCVYYNMFFNAKKKFNEAEEQEQRMGTGGQATPQKRVGNLAYEDAIAKFAKVIEQYPKSKWVDDAYYYIGLGYFRMGQYDRSLEAFDEIITNHPKSKYIEEAGFWIAVCRVELGERLAGRERLRRLTTTATKKKWQAEAWSRLADMYFEDKEYDSAAAAYLTVAEEFGSEEISNRARFKAGEAFTLAGQQEKALEQFYLTLQEKPPDNVVYATRVRMADAYFGREMIDSGLVLLEALAGSDLYYDSLGVLQLKIGGGLEQAGRYDEAIETYTDITETFDKTKWSAEAFYRIGYIHQKQFFDFPAAREYYEKAKQEFARSEFAQKAIEQSVTLATIEGFQKQIADGLLELMAIDDPEAFAAAKALADTTVPADTTATGDSTSAIDSNAIDTMTTMPGEADSAIAEIVPDSIMTAEANAQQPAPETVDSGLAQPGDRPTEPVMPEDSLGILTATDTLAHPDSAITIVDNFADADTAAPVDQSDSLLATAVPDTASNGITEPPPMPDDPNRTADTTISIDTILVIDTTYTFDTVLISETSMPLLREIPDTTVPAADSAFTPAATDTSAVIPVPNMVATTDSVATADSQSVPESPSAPLMTDSAAAGDTVLSGNEQLADDTIRVARLGDSPALADTSSPPGHSLPDSVIQSPPAFAVDTALSIDTTFTVDTTVTIELTAAAKKALAEKEKRRAIVDELAVAYFNLAQAFHMVLDEPDSAMSYYDTLIARFPDSEQIPRALFASASLREDHFQDSAGAAENYQRVLRDYGRTDYAGAAIERLGLGGTPADTGYPGAAYRRAEQMFLAEKRPDSARILFEKISTEFPGSIYAPQAAFAALVTTEELPQQKEDSALYYLFATYIDSFPGTPYADAAKVKIGSGIAARPGRERTVIATETTDSAYDSALAAITAEQRDTTRVGLPRAPRPKQLGQFKYPESEMGTEPWEGSVVFKIFIDFTGKIEDYELVGPSERPDIDLEATAAVEGTFFDPDSIPPESLNMWYQYDVRVTAPGRENENIFNDPAYNNQ